MLRAQILPFIHDYLKLLSDSLAAHHPAYRLTKTQILWISFCLTGILLTNSICWARYERASFGSWLTGALSWMFRQSKIYWDKLFKESVLVILNKYGITEGTLELDDTDRARSKNAKKLHNLGKQKDKKSGGFFNGQSIVFLLLVSDKISIPVGFKFYKMDPVWKAWKTQDNILKKQKVKKPARPVEPKRDPKYPTKNKIGLNLVTDFKRDFGYIKVRAIKADALFGTAEFVDGVGFLYPKSQVISQIRNNQKIIIKGEEVVVSEYFDKKTAKKGKLIIRGGKEIAIEYVSVIGEVKAQSQKRLIIALKYEGEVKYRYIIARNMTWRVQDVLECYSLRWLVEVFFQDWKMYEGWGQLTKHVGEEGSRQSLILSLLFDHCLLSHPAQSVRLKDNLPIYTVGSLRNKLSVQSLMQVFEYILEQPDPKKYLEKLAENIDQVYVLRVSSKHMSGRSPNFGLAKN